jgi:dinuclear metal center YbgI/SA1388 family protein
MSKVPRGRAKTKGPTIGALIEFLRERAPTELAEDWDNVGLLVGDQSREVSAVMTCLTLTSDVATEAIERGAELVVTHHPILFRPVQQITADTAEGRMLLELIAARICVYSAHTAYDSAAAGINQQLAELFELSGIGALREAQRSDAAPGAGRYGTVRSAMTLDALLRQVKQRLGIDRLQYVGEPSLRIERLGIACGSAAEFLPDAHRLGCQALLTGEARFHACLQARELGMALILVGHYASERPAMERLAETLSHQFPSLTVWASQRETDPLRWA